MGKKGKKGRVDVVYSTNQDFDYSYDGGNEDETLEPSQQDLRIWIDRKQRKGKEATLITGFVGSEDDAKDLCRYLKTSCGVGGSAKGGDIIVQGNVREKVLKLLTDKGYRAKLAGG